MRENFWLQIYPFQAISSNFGFCGRKAPPRMRKIFDFRFIHFRQFRATLVFCGRKAPPPRMRENFLTLDLSISGNFEWLWFLWQKSPPPRIGKIFWLQIYPFQAILSNFGFVAENLPQDEGKLFDFRFIHFRQFQATLFLWQKSPPPRLSENFLTSDLSISGNFDQLWFCGRKAPRRLRENFWLQIYPFQAIFSNFGFCGRNPPPLGWGKNFDFRFIHFRQFRATLVIVAEKPPPPRMRENFLTSDLSISGNFEWLWFLWQKSPPPPRIRENFLTSDLSISGNFEQLWFLWQKTSPQDEGKFFDFRFIHFRQFQATLVFVAENLPPGWGEIFWLQIYPFQANSSDLGFCGRKAPCPPPG